MWSCLRVYRLYIQDSSIPSEIRLQSEGEEGGLLLLNKTYPFDNNKDKDHDHDHNYNYNYKYNCQD